MSIANGRECSKDPAAILCTQNKVTGATEDHAWPDTEHHADQDSPSVLRMPSGLRRVLHQVPVGGRLPVVLADLVGRSTDWLAKIETGRRKPPRIDMLGALSRVLQNGSLPHRRIGA